MSLIQREKDGGGGKRGARLPARVQSQKCSNCQAEASLLSCELIATACIAAHLVSLLYSLYIKRASFGIWEANGGAHSEVLKHVQTVCVTCVMLWV